MLERLIVLLLFIIIIFPSIVPLFKTNVAGTADGIGHRFRLVSFKKSLDEGISRPRWAKDAALGYGAPTFLFNYPLPYYLTSFVMKLGFSANKAGQLYSALAILLSAVFMYVLCFRITGSFFASLVGSSIYTYAPYHLQMTYLYDSWGEELAFVFAPLILFLILKINDFLHSGNKTKKDINKKKAIARLEFSIWNLFLVLSWVLFFLSHNVSVLMFAPVILFLGFISVRSKGRARISQLVLLISNFILAVLISAFFWLPAWILKDYMKYPDFMRTEGIMRGSFFKSYTFQFNTMFKVIKEGITYYLDFTVGLPILIALMLGAGLSLLIIIKYIGKKKRAYDSRDKNILSNEKIFLLGAVLVLLASLFLTNYISNIVWRFPLLAFVLYPYRFLMVVSFSGSLIASLLTKRHWLIGIMFILTAFVQGRPYTNPYVEIFPFDNSYFYQTQTVFGPPFTRKNMLIKEFLPVSASLSFLEKEEKKYYQTKGEKNNIEKKEMFISKGDGKILNIEGYSESISASINSSTPVNLVVNRFFFPNWQAFIDDTQIEIGKNIEGRIVLTIPAGVHKLLIKFGKTKVEKIANIISTAGVVILLIEFFFLFRMRLHSIERIKK